MSANNIPTVRHHPQFGYSYLPNLRKRVSDAAGGHLLRTNAAGFRSEREFEPEKRPGVRRALLFGDSQAAGDGVSNAKRFSDLIETRVDDFELYNMSLTGSGTDQQFTMYREFAPQYAHDLVIVSVFVENVMRVPRKVLVRPNPQGQIQYYGKPYFEVSGGELVLGGVPVPERPWSAETLPEQFRGAQGDFQLPPVTNKSNKLHRRIRRVVPNQVLAYMIPLLRGFVRNRALPAYDRPNTPEWQLLRRILECWIAESQVPVLIVPLPLSHFIIDPSDARPCQARYSELFAATGCHLFDPLPGLCRLSTQERRDVWDHRTGHLSEFGHRTLADMLAPVIDSILPASVPDQEPARFIRA